MKKGQGVLAGGASAHRIRKLRRALSPDIAEVLHLLDMFAASSVADVSIGISDGSTVPRFHVFGTGLRD